TFIGAGEYNEMGEWILCESIKSSATIKNKIEQHIKVRCFDRRQCLKLIKSMFK
ncbi:MAG: hypothetical protein ACI8RD_007120, partial [Bacillariaceae sp.]